MLGYDATVGFGYFENNTGTLIRRGAIANYSQALFFQDDFKLLFGVNLFGFSEKLSDIPISIPDGSQRRPIVRRKQFYHLCNPRSTGRYRIV